MLLVGMIWAAFAPVLLLMATAGLWFAIRRRLGRGALAVSFLVVLTPVAVAWLVGRSEFESVCSAEGRPVVYRHDKVDGVFLSSSTANSFGMRYLQEEGFKWVEARSIYKRDGWVRYEVGEGGSITTKDIPALTARYEVREVTSAPFTHTHLSQTQVVDRQTGDVLAKAGSAIFDGGYSKIVLGAWGVQSCPSAMSDSDGFRAYYHLAKNTLR